MKPSIRLCVLAVVALIVGGCEKAQPSPPAAGQPKQSKEAGGHPSTPVRNKDAATLGADDIDAMRHLLIAVYKEAFPMDEKLMIFRGTKIYQHPKNPGQRLKTPIETVSLMSGFIYDSETEVQDKVAPVLQKKFIGWKDASGAIGRLSIGEYILDLTPAGIGPGSSPAVVTIIPLTVRIDEETPK